MDTINKDFAAFRNGVEAAPVGTCDHSKQVRNEIGVVVDGMIQSFRIMGLPVCNSDGAHNVEAVIFDWVRKAAGVSEFDSVIGLGRLSGETLERAVKGMERDRDFLLFWDKK